GYLLDEIRKNGEKPELKDEVVSLARKHGITTPYTSYLVVPDNVPPTTTQRPPALATRTPPPARPAAPTAPYLHLQRGAARGSPPAPRAASSVTITTKAATAPAYGRHSAPAGGPNAAPMAPVPAAETAPSTGYAPGLNQFYGDAFAAGQPQADYEQLKTALQ